MFPEDQIRELNERLNHCVGRLAEAILILAANPDVPPTVFREIVLLLEVEVG